MTTCNLNVIELASIFHAINMTPLIERPNRRCINKLAGAYRREGGDPYGEFPDLSPTATGLEDR